jgi:hypothetical protein
MRVRFRCLHYDHVWEYKGRSRYHVTCSVIRYNVNIARNVLGVG